MARDQDFIFVVRHFVAFRLLFLIWCILLLLINTGFCWIQSLDSWNTLYPLKNSSVAKWLVGHSGFLSPIKQLHISDNFSLVCCLLDVLFEFWSCISLRNWKFDSPPALHFPGKADHVIRILEVCFLYFIFLLLYIERWGKLWFTWGTIDS